MYICTHTHEVLTTNGTNTQLWGVGGVPVMCRALNLGFWAEAIYKKRGSGTICPKLPWKSKQRSEADMYVDSVFID